MSNIKESALQKAILFLKASGAEYVAIFEGKIYESIKDPQPKQDEGVERRSRVRSISGYIRDFKTSTRYLEKIDKLAPGETVTFERNEFDVLKDNNAWTSFIASVQSASRVRFGASGYILERQVNSIELLRVE